ncbi:MAG: lamin tail domain-containing protein [Planctomycetes bacterium]|nr:lamin tail domain-containing protein [Planctomycetota bacterium]
MASAPDPRGSGALAFLSSPLVRSLLLPVALASAAPAAAFAQDLTITEILAVNGGGIEDEDGNRPDWIEIRNAGRSRVWLDGWYLTDDPFDPGKWRFPAVDLAPGAFLLVFASGKDRARPGGELHASFQLDGDGEYLALVRPDATIACEFAPAYPRQVADVSYGVVQEVLEVALLEAGAAARILIPREDLGTSWTGADFDDSGWTPATTGIGFDRDEQEPAGGENVARGKRASQSSTGFAGFASRAVDGNTDGDYGNTSVSHTSPSDSEPFWEVDLAGTFPIERIVLWNRTDAYPERLSNFRLMVLDEARTIVASSDHFTDKSFPATPSYEIVPASGTAGRFVRIEKLGPDRNGETIISLAEVEVFEEPAGFRRWIATDIEEAMWGIHPSAYVRMPFAVDDPAAFDVLTLRIRYDEGFIAYLNGEEIARRNAPESAAWDAAAPAERPDREAARLEAIDVTEHLDALRAGANVLAIHAVNAASDDPDFLLLPALEALSIRGEALRFFPEPTPGGPNGSGGYIGLVADTKFSRDRGYYDEPFDVEISTETEGAEIRFTTDGTAPEAGAGDVYAGPIAIRGTTTLRAAAFKDGWRPANADTQTYIFAEQVIRQDGAGFPRTWGGTTADYQMDPNVVDAAAYRETIAEDLKTIPALSIVMPTGDLFGPSGIYSNPEARGPAWERVCSMELIYPRTGRGFQVDCGIRIFGYGWRSHANSLKHAFRLMFKREYGPARLEYPFFPDWPIRRFNTIVLRSQGSRGWNDFRTSIEQTQYMRDAWARYTARAMGKMTTSSSFVNLYLNGLYWGLYNPVERPDAAFMEDHLGGDELDYDALNARVGTVEVIDGDREEWDELLEMARGDVRSPEAYAQIRRYVDVPDLIDYMMLQFYTCNRDWPGSNGNNMRVAGGVGIRVPFKQFCWDMEYSIWYATDNVLSVLTQYDSPTTVYSRLLANPEFKVEFGDRARRHLFGAGALTPEATADLWMDLASEIDRAIVGESARWGDRRREPPYTRDVEWVREQERLMATFFPQRTANLLAQFKGAGLYPRVDAPTFNRDGGTFEAGFALAMTAPKGTIYYSLDAIDPREAGGGISPAALAYVDPIPLEGVAFVKARALDGTAWSALAEAVFRQERPLDALRITEILYRPLPGPRDAEAYEFIEIKNTGSVAADLGDAALVGGVEFFFPAGWMIPPGGFAVVAADLEAFAQRYGNAASVAGAYGGRLSNAGELIELVDASGERIVSVRYDDSALWPAAADGDGYSLVPVDPAGAGDPNLASYWRASAWPLGSPGADDPAPLGEGGLQRQGDFNQDGAIHISDAVSLLSFLFGGGPAKLPCGGDAPNDGDRFLLDIDGDRMLGLGDAIHLLTYLFQNGPPPVLGEGCVRVPGCPDACGP